MANAPRPSDGIARSARPSNRSRDVAVWAATRLAAGLGRVCGHHATDTFGILMYHRVTDRIAGVDEPTWNVTPGRLRAQLAGLVARGFQPWPLRTLLDYRRRVGGVPSRAFVVTFDDGYANNFLNALPVLAELDVPATVFLATKYLDGDTPFPFDDWSAAGLPSVPVEAWRPLSTWQCRELLASGLIELGAHTHRHERYVGRGEAFRRDLTECLGVLVDKFGIVHPTFALPYGAADDDMIEVARQLPLACCLSTRARPVRASDDEFTWGRFDVSQHDTAGVLAAKLSGWYSAVTAAGKKLVRPLSLVAGAGDERAPAGSTDSEAAGWNRLGQA
jgi:peptidoglycan/xylan/chitin deacetylase (PgdA/CDA1 family)